MHTSILRLFAAALVSLFIVAACASDTGAQWTYAPVAVSVSESSGESSGSADGTPSEQSGASGSEAAAAASETAQADTTQAEATDTTEASATDDGGPRVIDLVLTGALQITDTAGTQVKDIPVTPGETVIFRVENTAGFDHNFYIGTDEQLIVPAATTDTGIPTFQSGVQELEWVVPADISGLKFGCTVPGHYSLMQGTFSVSP